MARKPKIDQTTLADALAKAKAEAEALQAQAQAEAKLIAEAEAEVAAEQAAIDAAIAEADALAKAKELAELEELKASQAEAEAALKERERKELEARNKAEAEAKADAKSTEDVVMGMVANTLAQADGYVSFAQKGEMDVIIGGWKVPCSVTEYARSAFSDLFRAEERLSILAQELICVGFTPSTFDVKEVRQDFYSKILVQTLDTAEAVVWNMKLTSKSNAILKAAKAEIEKKLASAYARIKRHVANALSDKDKRGERKSYLENVAKKIDDLVKSITEHKWKEDEDWFDVAAVTKALKEARSHL